MFIDYENLGAAQKFYKNLGYKYVDVPWLVSEETSSITAPPGVQRYVVTKGSKVKEFVASGEQGFLYMAFKGFLPEGMYVTISPCLRNDNFDFSHSKQFMKCELINIDYKPFSDPIHSISVMASHAAQFFFSLGLETTLIDIGDNSFDLVDPAGIELGSYGYRTHEGIYWIYGSGIAEPRFSRQKVKNDISSNSN